MIDTIKLSLKKGSFRILYPENFNPSAEGILEPPYTKMGSKSYLKCVLNPTKSLIKINGYLPRITLIKAHRSGEFQIDIKIECSLPKMMYNNNFDELEDIDFAELLACIQSKLRTLGISTSIEAIKDASVDRVDFSKNIHLQDYTTCSMVINELHKASLNSRIDIGKEKFRNGGHALHFHTKNRDIVFYDKLKDLQQAKKSESKAIEDTNYIQLNLLEDIKPVTEVLRMEVRLNKRKEIKATLDRVGIDIEPTFFNLFNSNISQQVLSLYWEQINKASQHLKFKSEGVFDVAETIRSHYPELKSQKLLEYIGAMVLSNEVGSRRLRNFLGYEGSESRNKKWYRLQKSIKSLEYFHTNSFLAISGVSKGLKNYEPTKLINLTKKV